MPLSDADSDVIDASVIESLRSLAMPGEPDILADVVQLFLADSPVMLASLSAAMEAGDGEAVSSIAHRLRGSALELGAIRMVPLCAEIELAAHSGSIAQCRALAESLERELAAACAALEGAVR